MLGSERRRRNRRDIPFDDVLEERNTLSIPKLVNVVHVDRFRTTAARNKDVGLVPKVRAVTEVGSVNHNLAVCRDLCQRSHRETMGSGRLTRQLNVPIVDEDEVAILAELGAVELLDHETSTSEADELRSVEAIRVVEGARSINDCRAF